MDLQAFFTQGLSLLGSHNLIVAAFLFLICFVGEAFAIFVPYLLETTWVSTGYLFSLNFASAAEKLKLAESGIMPLSVNDLTILVLAALAGRQAGALLFYILARGGTSFVVKYMKRISPRTDLSNSLAGRLYRKTNLLSPFSVAVGRLLWLRIPLTFVLAAQKRTRVLMLGVLYSSLAYEFIYIGMGAIVGKAIRLEPYLLIVYAVISLTVIYSIGFAIRHLIAYFSRKSQTTQSISQDRKDS